MSGTVLDRIVEAKRGRLRAGEFEPEGQPSLPSNGSKFLAALRKSPAVIAEIKHSSPSAGEIVADPERRIEEIASAYRRGGASVLSVVVEQDFFGGDPKWLARAKRASGLPVLMKDFVVDERQIDFALSLGADAILLIVSALDDESLVRLYRKAREKGLAVLVEAHDEGEIERAARAGAEIIGVNARDLKSFRVDLGRLARLGHAIPETAIRVAESGIRNREDVESLSSAGFGAFLVGESLLRLDDPARGLRRLRREGTTEVKVCGVTRDEDLDACVEAGVDQIGLNFSPRSPRRVGSSDAIRLRERAGKSTKVVAVFAGNPIGEILGVIETVRPDVLQLTDPPEGEFSRRWDLPVWQTVHVSAGSSVSSQDWPGDRLLFDSGGKERPGGTGSPFDWALLESSRPKRPFVLAGGLNARNVAEAIRRVRPAGVDVASGVETAPGIKDRGKIFEFVREVRAVRDEETGENR